jgi:hypothetical protein
MNESEKPFKIRSYGFGELARLYSPDTSVSSANRKLHRWIRINTMLQSRLAELGFNPSLRVLSPKMVQEIVDAIGEP